MKLTAELPPADRERVEGRLPSNPIAWLTTVRADGQPVTVPIWFLLGEDETILLYSRPRRPHHQLPANEHPAYLAEYIERMGSIFGTPEQFARLFSVALIVAPARLHT